MKRILQILMISATISLSFAQFESPAHAMKALQKHFTGGVNTGLKNIINGQDQFKQ